MDIINKCIFLGRVTKDLEAKHVGADNTAILNFTLAVDRKFKKEGQPTADFISFVAIGKVAEIIEKWCHKGSQIAVTSRCQTRTYEKDNVTQYVTEFVVEEFDFAGGSKDSPEGGKKETSSEDEEFVL